MLATAPVSGPQKLALPQYYDEETVFDLDETIPEPYLLSKSHDSSQGSLNLGEEAFPIESQIPTNTGFDLSLVTPHQTGLESRYANSIKGKLPEPSEKLSRSLDTAKGSILHQNKGGRSRHKEVKFVDQVPQTRPDPGSRIRRRSAVKYDIDESEDTVSDNGPAKLESSDLDSMALATSPYAASVPIHILSPGMHSFMSKEEKQPPKLSDIVAERPIVSSSHPALEDEEPLSGRTSPTEELMRFTQAPQSIMSSPTSNNPIVNPFVNTTLPGPHQNGFQSATPPGGVRIDSSTSFMGNPFAQGPVTKLGKEIAEAAGDVQSYVGGLDGSSGYDPSNVGSLANSRGGLSNSLKHGVFQGPMSFSERFMLEEMQEASAGTEN